MLLCMITVIGTVAVYHYFMLLIMLLLRKFVDDSHVYHEFPISMRSNRFVILTVKAERRENLIFVIGIALGHDVNQL